MLTLIDWIRAPRALRVLLMLIVASVTILTVPAPSSAQVAPGDAAAVLLRTAIEFEGQGEWDLARALYLHISERYPGTVAADEAREQLTRPGAERADRVSRLELSVFGTLYGLWLGVAVPTALGADHTEAYGAGLLAGVPLGLFSALSAQRSQQYTEGQTRAISWGGIWGSWQGLGWTEVLGIGQYEVCSQYGCYERDDNTEVPCSLAIRFGRASPARRREGPRGARSTEPCWPRSSISMTAVTATVCSSRASWAATPGFSRVNSSAPRMMCPVIGFG